MTVSSCKFARVVIGVKVERKDVEIQPVGDSEDPEEFEVER